MDRLEDILKLVGTVQGKKEGRWIVQKYIGKPCIKKHSYMIAVGMKVSSDIVSQKVKWPPLSHFFV